MLQESNAFSMESSGGSFTAMTTILASASFIKIPPDPTLLRSLMPPVKESTPAPWSEDANPGSFCSHSLLPYCSSQFRCSDHSSYSCNNFHNCQRSYHSNFDNELIVSHQKLKTPKRNSKALHDAMTVKQRR
jgi:hypothetical protein